MKDPFFKYIHELQDSITSKLELIDGTATLKKIFGNAQKAAADGHASSKMVQYSKKEE